MKDSFCFLHVGVSESSNISIKLLCTHVERLLLDEGIRGVDFPDCTWIRERQLVGADPNYRACKLHVSTIKYPDEGILIYKYSPYFS